MPRSAEQLALANEAVCEELGLAFWMPAEAAGRQAKVYRCQVVGYEAVAIVADDGWWRLWPMHQEPAEANKSWAGFGPEKLEERLANPAHVRSRPEQFREV